MPSLSSTIISLAIKQLGCDTQPSETLQV